VCDQPYNTKTSYKHTPKWALCSHRRNRNLNVPMSQISAAAVGYLTFVVRSLGFGISFVPRHGTYLEVNARTLEKPLETTIATRALSTLSPAACDIRIPFLVEDSSPIAYVPKIAVIRPWPWWHAKMCAAARLSDRCD
jgi:hypothetical protein